MNIIVQSLTLLFSLQLYADPYIIQKNIYRFKYLHDLTICLNMLVPGGATG